MKSNVHSPNRPISPARPSRNEAKARPASPARRNASFAKLDEIAFFDHDSIAISRTSTFSSASSNNLPTPSANHSVSVEYARALGHCVMRGNRVLWPSGQRYSGPTDYDNRPHGNGNLTLANGQSGLSKWRHGRCLDAAGPSAAALMGSVEHYIDMPRAENSSLRDQLRKFMGKGPRGPVR